MARYVAFLIPIGRYRTVDDPPPGFNKRQWAMYSDREVEFSGESYCSVGVQWVLACFTSGKMEGECRWFRDGEILNWSQDAETCS